MDVAPYLEKIRNQPEYDGQIRHVETLPVRPGRYVEPSVALPDALVEMLRRQGVERLYTHQTAALDAARAGRDLVVVTGTASGKTLCYNLPILEKVLTSEDARALYLFPTKALAQDQMAGLATLLEGSPSLLSRVRPGVYDGDTPTSQRRRIRGEAHLVLSNPDMLHASMLPYHPKWSRFFANLNYIVLDEVHTYRGILGANVACVLRRLQRICEHYDSHPVYLAASATIANPGELTSRLIGRDVEVVDDDGSPRGRKHFVFWNPAARQHEPLGAQSPADDAVTLMVDAILHGGQVLTFTRTRQAAELVYRYAKQRLEDRSSPLADKLCAYRGGYLPEERRRIERDLFSGTLRGVAATNALELGIDVGSLDVTLLVGYPGTIASTWQQAGRSGRRHEESLAVLLAGNDPVDQYLLSHPDYFFSQTPEQAVVDPENPYVLARHLKAAAFELPLSDDDIPRFGPVARPLLEVLEQQQELTEVEGRFYFSGGQNPAVGISLRHMSDNTFSIVLRRDGDASRRSSTGQHEVIANVDAISAPELVYPQAVYLHHGESYLVRQLDLEGKVAYVERRETDYYTQAVLESNVRIVETRDRRPGIPGAQLRLGDVDVSWQTVAFKKIKFNTRENIGLGPVDIPAQNLETTAFWLALDKETAIHMKQAGLRPSEGAVGLRNLLVVALPMVAMCDSRDVSGVVDSQNLGRTTLIVYDRYPGGLGYSERGYQQMETLLEICHAMVDSCACQQGCPSCVGLPNLRPAIHSDPDLMRGDPMPNKGATLRLLQLLRATAAEPVPIPTTTA
ncbi:MAG: DEAD/DEAH box helicase [Pirellulales bacterium]